MEKIYRIAHVLFVLFMFQNIAEAKIKYTVRLAPDSITYRVYLRPDLSYNAPLNTVNSAQVTLVVPTGGFKVANLQTIKGNWANNVSVVAPAENPGFDYFAFALTGSTTQITLSAGVEVLLFTFRNSGVCTGEMRIIENTDPFYPPNMANIASGNQIGFFGGGPGNSWSGNYLSGDSDCTVVINPPGCQDIWDDTLLPDTVYTCGACGTSLPLNFTGDSILWSPNTDIVCTDCPNPTVYPDSTIKYTVKVANGNGCFRFDSIWVVVLKNLVFTVEGVNPSNCGASNGQITVHSQTPGINYAFSLSGLNDFQSDSVFTGLDTGFYTVYLIDTVHDCKGLSFITLTCDTVPTLPPNGQGSISGSVFKDCATVGVFSSNEMGLPNMQVKLTGTDSLGAPVSMSQNTASNGTYLFDKIPSGTYQVQFFATNSLFFSPRHVAGAAALFDSDADPLTGKTASISLQFNQDMAGVNAGLRDTVAPIISPTHPWLQNLTNGDTLYMECGATTVFNATSAAGLDNCDGSVPLDFLEDLPITGDCSDGYLAKMHCGFRAVDQCGNSAEWWFYVVVQDTTAPVLIGVPTNVALLAGTPFPPAPVITASDFCTQTVAVQYTDTLVVTVCDSILTRTWLATDACGNTSKATQVLSIDFCACNRPVVDTVIIRASLCDADDGSAEILLTMSPSLFEFQWIPNTGLPNANANLVTELASGNYLVFVSDKNNSNCFIKLDIFIPDTCFCLQPQLENLAITPARCGGSTGIADIQLPGSEMDYNYAWIPNTGFSSNFGATHTALAPGAYLVFVTHKDVDSCFLKLDIIIPNDTLDCFVTPQDSLYAGPGGNFGISPNDDTINDYFSIPNLDLYPNHLLSVYNRWGSMVYTKRNYDGTWAGDWNGKKLPDGTYFYLIETEKTMFSGYLQINRN
jgi:gliding motility-associated-like protein